MNEMYELYLGDCLEVMDRLIEAGIVVDAVVCDPPYGTTRCKWDNIIPFDPMWSRLNTLVKENGAILLFGTEPFSTQLRSSNLKNYRYDWIWKKTRPQNFMNAKKMPLKNYEIVSVFYKKLPTYNPQGLIKVDRVVKNGGTKNPQSLKKNGDLTTANMSISCEFYKQEYTNYPTQILEYANVGADAYHPTQKPTDLLEYLIRTYTNEGDLVLDFTMGSGSTGVACVNTNRRFIGIELEEYYYKVARSRLEKAVEERS